MKHDSDGNEALGAKVLPTNNVGVRTPFHEDNVDPKEMNTYTQMHTGKVGKKTNRKMHSTYESLLWNILSVFYFLYIIILIFSYQPNEMSLACLLKVGPGHKTNI